MREIRSESRNGAWWSLLAFSVGLAVAQFVLTSNLVDGGLLNSYPFTSSDSYDWLLEGYALQRWTDGAPLVELPVLRNPIFVLTTFVDYLLGGAGYFVLLVISGGLLLLLLSLVFAGRWASAPPFESGVVIWFVAISPLAFFRAYVLADLLATALMTGAAALLVPYARTENRRWLVLGALIGLLAGLTQIYGLIPFVAICGWLFLASLRRRSPDWYLGSALVATLSLALLLHLAWRMAIPHDSVPRNWSLLDLSTAMADFYSDAWAFAFGGILPVVILVAIQRWKLRPASPIVIGSWIAVAALLLGNFLYQWEDFRLTIPASCALALALVISMGDGQRTRRSRFTIGVYMMSAVLMTVVSLAIAPASYWTPSIDEMELSPENTWIAGLLSAKPVDRFHIDDHCEEDVVFCEAVPLPESLSQYQQAVLSTFKALAPR